jgi:hypothetical protein
MILEEEGWEILNMFRIKRFHSEIWAENELKK